VLLLPKNKIIPRIIKDNKANKVRIMFDNIQPDKSIADKMKFAIFFSSSNLIRERAKKHKKSIPNKRGYCPQQIISNFKNEVEMKKAAIKPVLLSLNFLLIKKNGSMNRV
jgi:uridine kinase